MANFKKFLITTSTIIFSVHASENDISRALCSNLNVMGICAKKIKANCIEGNTINADQVCTQTVFAQTACVEQLMAQKLSTNEIELPKICSDEMYTNQFCAQSATLNEACILHERAELVCADHINTTSICVFGALKQCLFLTSRVGTSFNYTYTLGEIVDFDTVQADPSSSILQNPTRYMAPESGLYMLTIQLLTDQLTGNSIIGGAPIGSIEVYVAGLLRRQLFVPYLTFNHSQSAILTSLISLRQGEELIVRYKVFVLDAISGFIPYSGAVTLLGAPGFSNNSTMIIHYLGSECPLSTDCPPCDIPCQPCQPCNIPPLQSCTFSPCIPCPSDEPCVSPCANSCNCG